MVVLDNSPSSQLWRCDSSLAFDCQQELYAALHIHVSISLTGLQLPSLEKSEAHPSYLSSWESVERQEQKDGPGAVTTHWPGTTVPGVLGLR